MHNLELENLNRVQSQTLTEQEMSNVNGGFDVGGFLSGLIGDGDSSKSEISSKTTNTTTTDDNSRDITGAFNDDNTKADARNAKLFLSDPLVV